MLKKLPLAILAASTVTATMAADNFSLNNAVDAVVIQDNVWTNPAALNNTQNQVTANSSENVGAVFTLGGQKVGVHVGRVMNNSFPPQNADNEFDDSVFTSPQIDIASGTQPNKQSAGAVDLFWGGDLGAQTGIRVGFGIDRNVALARTEFATSEGDIALTEEPTAIEGDNPGTTVTLDVTENADIANYSEVDVEFGQILPRGGYKVRFGMPSFNSVNVVDYSATIANGSTTSTESRLIRNQIDSDFSFELDFGLKQFFSREFYVLANGSYNSLNLSGTNETKIVDTSNNTTEILEQLDVSSNTIRASVGYGLVKRIESITMRLEQSVDYRRTVATTTIYADQNTAAPSAPTGTVSEVRLPMQDIDLPFAASVEGRANEKWTWRLGVSANLAEIAFDKETATVPKVENGKFTPNYTLVNAQTSSYETGRTAFYAIGTGWQPHPNLQINAELSDDFLFNGLTNSSLVSSLSASYKF